MLLPGLALALLLGATLGAGGREAAAAGPAELAVAGGPLVRAGEAVRRLLWIDLYRVELYLPPARRESRELGRPGLAKAFRVEMLFGGELPETIPEEWAEKLLPPLAPADQETLKVTYAGLESGDELLFSFAPGRGTLMEVNGRPRITTGDHRFMAGILALFVGPDAASPSMRRDLLAEVAPRAVPPATARPAPAR
ncbi:MAG: chalcone isomerase family protein [Tistlia sp.]|uniref:chalcone isomerase family protein n=1 Tax=Tistlia sp. TaxID=3057121 RepID=UPI0034A250EC